MGFIEETGAAQYYRDARIAQIYEGTNGIQAIDLVTRKLPLSGGAAVRALIRELRDTVDAVMGANDPAFGATGPRLGEAVDSLGRATDWILTMVAVSPDAALAGATTYLRLFGLAFGGCLLAKEALAATRDTVHDGPGRVGRVAIAPILRRTFGGPGARPGPRCYRGRGRDAVGRCRNRCRMTDHVIVTDDEPLRILRLNRPGKKNAITDGMYETLAEALENAAVSKNIRCVVITGGPTCFTAGGDLADFLHAAQDMDGLRPQVMRLLHRLAHAGKPLVAAVEGMAIGIGTTMLLHCDYVVAAMDARFSTPFAHLGLVPEAGSSLAGAAPDGGAPRLRASRHGSSAQRG